MRAMRAMRYLIDKFLRFFPLPISSVRDVNVICIIIIIFFSFFGKVVVGGWCGGASEQIFVCKNKQGVDDDTVTAYTARVGISMTVWHNSIVIVIDYIRFSSKKSTLCIVVGKLTIVYIVCLFDSHQRKQRNCVCDTHKGWVFMHASYVLVMMIENQSSCWKRT